MDAIKTNLKVRYKVIADYPGNDEYEVGQIIQNIGPSYIAMLNDYPHIFRELEWFEYLTESELSDIRYFKCIEGEWLKRYNAGDVLSYEQLKGFLPPSLTASAMIMRQFIPATIEEYPIENQ